MKKSVLRHRFLRYRFDSERVGIPAARRGLGLGLGLALALACLSYSAPATVWAQPPAAASIAQLPDFADLVERAGPAVVNIRTTARVGQRGGAPQLDENDPFYEFYRRFFPPGTPQPSPGPGQRRDQPRGVGSGFIISADGFIMTNAHVVSGADDIIVTLPDRREFKAKLIGADRSTDVAIVKVEATSLPLLRIGDPNRLRVGEWVIAIGSPFGLDNSVTAGIVSAKARDTGDYLPFIQTDVAVNPGNSGGPLINLRGEVVGVNSQIFTTSGAYAGISFAIPIDEAMRVADQLRGQGRVTRGRIGVRIESVTREVAEAIGLAKPQGALVNQIEPDTPAEKAGIEAGDVILRFDGKVIDRETDLPRIVGATKPGSKVPVTVWRKGKSIELSITVAEREPDQVQGRRGDQSQKPEGSVSALGMSVSDLPADKQKQLKIRGGVRVDAVEGAAAVAGVRVSDVVVAINNVEVQNARWFTEYVGKLDAKRNVVLLLQRGDQRTFIIIRPGDR